MKSDSQLQQDVLAELKWESSVNATDIGVEVKDGVVTLAGHVESLAAKFAAERATQRVSGVKAVAVEMDVNLPGPSTRTDAEIALTAANVLSWTASLPVDAVKVLVEHGWITLSGEVEWEYQRTAATAALRPLMGVRGVSDQIGLKQRSAATFMKEDIEAALRRHHQIGKGDVSVEVSGSEVTLSGIIHSFSEREAACDSAWGTSGVHKVVDNLKYAW
ncbi:MAG: BON domain-containing protein [Vicinamibacteria bacterium]